VPINNAVINRGAYTFSYVGSPRWPKQQVLSGTGPVVLGGGRIYPEWLGAAGDSTTDDTASLQAALDTGAGGPIVWLSKDKRYRITAELMLSSDTVVDGEGTILVDYTQAISTGGLSAYGTLGGSTALTENAAITDTSVSVDPSGYSVGDLVAIGSTKSVGAYPVLVKTISAIGAGSVSFTSSLGVSYAVADDAYIKKITPVEDVKIRNISFNTGENSDHTYNYVNLYGFKNAVVENVKFVDQSGDTSTATTAIYGQNFKYLYNTATAAASPSGQMLVATNISDVIADGNTSYNHAFGIGLYRVYKGVVTGNQMHGNSAGVRAYKFYGCLNPIVTENHAEYFENLLKIEGTSYGRFIGNVGNELSGHGINLSAAADGTANTFNRILGNEINTVDSGAMGAYIEATGTYNSITDNDFINAGGYAIYAAGNSNIIKGNTVYGFTTGGIAFSQLTIVEGNWIYDASASTPALATLGSFSAANASTITGNLSSNNPLASTGSNPANFALCTFSGNNISGQPRIFYVSAMPTTGAYVAGDRVVISPPVDGQPKAYIRLTAGTAHVLNTDWKSEGDI